MPPGLIIHQHRVLGSGINIVKESKEKGMQSKSLHYQWFLNLLHTRITWKGFKAPAAQAIPHSNEMTISSARSQASVAPQAATSENRHIPKQSFCTAQGF